MFELIFVQEVFSQKVSVLSKYIYKFHIFTCFISKNVSQFPLKHVYATNPGFLFAIKVL